MSVIILKNINLSYGERDLFKDLSADFQEGYKVGLVGRNGSGKSTLLKTIAGTQPIDSGLITVNKNKKIAFLPQEVVVQSEKTVFDEAFAVFEQYTLLEREQVAIEQQLENNPVNASELVERYQDILDALTHFNRSDAEQRAVTILAGLGFSRDALSQPVPTLSVGWKMRLVLAKLLLEQADFYLFDEPTNHLDIVAKEWFLNFLQQAPWGYLLVTHDRYFLDHACDWIFELSRGNGTMYHGNYSSYLKQYEHRQEERKAAHYQQQKEIARKKETIERFRASANKAKMAQSMIKQLDKMERIELDPPEPNVSFSFPELERSGKIVVKVRNIAYRYGEKQLFKNASCEIQRGQKVALVAANGVGKSTLLSLIAGVLPLQTGDVEVGHNVHMAYFEQDQTKVLKPQKTVFQEVSDACSDVSERRIRSFLGSFLFTGDDVYKKIEVLSGGERNRVAMVKVLLQNANFLVLDEPTNHLDLYAKSVLLQALQDYKGTLLFVSHDHQFIQELATDIVELTPNGLFFYPGSYEEYLEGKKRKESAGRDARSDGTKTLQEKKRPRGGTKETHKKIRVLEQRIHKLEQKIEEKTAALSSHDRTAARYQDDLAVIQELQEELDSAVSEWESLIEHT